MVMIPSSPSEQLFAIKIRRLNLTAISSLTKHLAIPQSFDQSDSDEFHAQFAPAFTGVEANNRRQSVGVVKKTFSTTIQQRPYEGEWGIPKPLKIVVSPHY